MTLALYKVVIARVRDLVVLFDSRLVVDFLSDHFPFFVERMFVILALLYVADELQQRHGKYFIIEHDDLNSLLIFLSFVRYCSAIFFVSLFIGLLEICFNFRNRFKFMKIPIVSINESKLIEKRLDDI